MITMKNFGKQRLGNSLFQLASLIGIANATNQDFSLKDWKYSKYFNLEDIIDNDLDSFPDINLKEYYFHFNKRFLEQKPYEIPDISIEGYFQSEKYWEHCKDDVKEILKFSFIFKEQVFLKYKVTQKWYYDATKELIAIHIRRGDYVNNPNYEQLPITYYILALFENFPNWRECNLMIFSDDIEYCKLHFGCLDNVYFSEGNSDIEDLCLMSLCTHFIIGNSTFGWWGSYLGEKEGTIVVQPNYLFAGKLLEENDSKDFYPERWRIFDHKRENRHNPYLFSSNKKLNLSNTLFIIPVTNDSKDRYENLELILHYLKENFECEIAVIENDTSTFANLVDKYDAYLYFSEHPDFHRTKMINFGATYTSTNIIANWDADVFIAPLQIYEAVQKLRNGADIVYPYDGTFLRIDRSNYDSLYKTLDIGAKKMLTMKDTAMDDVVSYGGAVFYNKAKFIEAGMENEYFVSFGAEDSERYYRFTTLGLDVQRIKGALYHLDHYKGKNSCTDNPHFKANEIEYNKVKKMNKEQLINYIKTWSWVNE